MGDDAVQPTELVGDAISSALRPGATPRVDALDRQLVHLMQVVPRVTWADAGRILGLSPTVVAHRWRRLRAEGSVWLAVHPHPLAPRHLTAVVEVTCEPGRRGELVGTLVEDGRVLSLEETSRGDDLLLTVVVGDVAQLSTLIFEDLPRLRGVQQLRQSIVLATLSTGGDWRVGALSEAQLVDAQRLAPVPSREDVADAWSPDLEPLLAALVADGRTSVADLAREAGLHPTTARRRLQALLASGRVMVRCDMVHADFGLPVTSAHFAQVAPGDVARTVAHLRRLPNLRMCLQVTGEYNLVFSLLSPSMASVTALQVALGRNLPWVSIGESRVVLRTPERMGWLLDNTGRPTGRVVVPSVFGR